MGPTLVVYCDSIACFRRAAEETIKWLIQSGELSVTEVDARGAKIALSRRAPNGS